MCILWHRKVFHGCTIIQQVSLFPYLPFVFLFDPVLIPAYDMNVLAMVWHVNMFYRAHDYL